MAKIGDCIESAVALGRMSREQAQDFQERVGRYTDEFELTGRVAPDSVLEEAEKAALAGQRAALEQARRQKALQIIKTSEAVDNIRSHPEGPATGLFSLLGNDITRNATYSNIDTRGRAVLGELHSKFAEALSALRTKYLGLVQDHDTMRNMVRELFGTDSGSKAAKDFAKAWSDVAEYARTRFNEAGGAIAKREDWGMPQWHDPALVAKVSKEEWLDTVIPLLDRSKMTDIDGVPMGDLEFNMMMDKMYDSISTNGLADLVPGTTGGKKLANRHNEHRVLAFKDADAWLAYADKFGRQDLFTTLTDHMERMAHDIAKLEIMGPNPDATFRVLRDIAKRDGGLESVGLGTLDALWRVVSGRTSDTVSLQFADASAAVRNWLTSARLGSAMLSAVSDIAFLRQTTAWTGLSYTKVMARAVKLANPANEAGRIRAVKMGLTADAWVTRALAANRFSEVTGSGISARAADLTMRASGLSAWTDAATKAFGMEFYSLMGDMAGRTFDELDKPFRNTLAQYGFTPRDWDIMRTTRTTDGFFDAAELMARTDVPEADRVRIGQRVNEMVLELSDYAIPKPNARSRALTTAGTQRGTLSGETMRFLAQFKSFPVSVILSHIYTGFYQHGVANKVKYLAGTIVGTTVLGALALQLKEISRGKDPKPMNSPEFWAAAFTQGGGAGIYGDFLYSGMFGTNRFGQNLITSAAGPGAGLVNDLAKVSFGNFGQLIQGDDPRVAADALSFARSYTPGASLWYTRLALEREVFDQLQLLADPAAQRKFRATRRRRKKEYGQTYVWRQGETTPDRAPDMSRLLGD